MVGRRPRWLLGLVGLAWLGLAPACSDLRDFRGTWAGPVAVGSGPGASAVLTGFPAATEAQLRIDRADTTGFAGELTVADQIAAAPLASVPGAEADVLAGLTFAGAPLRVYLGFAPMTDGADDALVVLSVHDEDRVELRLVRGGPAPRYGVFALARSAP